MTSIDSLRGTAVTVSTCLTLPELASAVVCSGPGHLTNEVRWVAAIEWPVESFVSPGDLILTTGIGCSDEMLATFVTEAADAGAVAICL